MGLNNSAWDIENNLIVKLLEGKIVARAFRGFKELAFDEIQTIYGDLPVLSSFEYPSSIRQTST